MRQQDFIRLIAQSVAAHRLRSSLTALGIGIGVTAVVLLTSIGEGLNTYMVEQFTQFGTTTVQVQPGKTVAVVGDGAVGLLGVLSAQQMGAERIIAMSRHEQRQQLAREFGATDIVTERGDDGVAVELVHFHGFFIGFLLTANLGHHVASITVRSSGCHSRRQP